MIVPIGARSVYFTQSSLKQSSVALSLHFGWDSQLNTSEVFWIDISLDTSLSDDFDTCFVDGHDATMDDAYKDELAIVPYVKYEIVAIAPTLDCPIILLKSPTIPEDFALIKAQCDVLHLSYHPKKPC